MNREFVHPRVSLCVRNRCQIHRLLGTRSHISPVPVEKIRCVRSFSNEKFLVRILGKHSKLLTKFSRLII